MDCMDKSCVADVSEECKAKSLLVECNCVPWEMPGFEVEFCQKEKNLNHFIAGNQQVHWGEVKCYLQLPNIWSRNLCWYHPVGWRVHKGDNERSDPTFDNWIRELKTEQFQTCQIWFFCKCNCVWYVKEWCINNVNRVNRVNSVNSFNSYSAVLPPSPMVFFIGPRSDHSLPMSVTDWLTHWLTNLLKI